MTDTGHPREWLRFAEVMSAAGENGTQIIMAPGNHDVSQYYGEVDHGKARRYIEYQAALNANIQAAFGKPLSSLTAEATKHVAGKIEGTMKDIRADNRYFNRVGYAAQFFPGIPPPYSIGKANLYLEHQAYLSGQGLLDLGDMRRGYIYPDWLPIPDDFDWHAFAIEVLVDDWYEEIWDSLFPLCSVDKLNRTIFFVLSSSPVLSTSISDSALGSVGKSQLERLHGLISNLPPEIKNVIVASHHTPFRRPGEWRLPLPRPIYSPSGWKRASEMLSELAFLPHDPD